MNNIKSLKIIRAPHLSEKASLLAEKENVFVFEVSKEANKNDVKKAVESLFKTVVKAVRIVNVKTKPKRFGQILGRSKAWKKAYVTLQEGQKIDFAAI